MVINGLTGQVTLFPSFLRIRRTGGINRLIQGTDKDIPLSQLTNVQIRRPTSLTAGGMQFFFSETQKNKVGVEKVTKHASLVVFAIKQLPLFETLKERINELQTT
jgi:hypothetical protein